AKPTEKHLKEVKRIFRYLRGTVNMGLWYTKDSGFELTGFSDADYAGCKDTFKSTSGGAQFLGEKLVSWSSKKQDCTALSTAKAEYVSLSACCAQEHVEKGTIELYFVKTDYQLADLFTKALPVDRFNYLVRRLGMRSLSPQELDRLAKSHEEEIPFLQPTSIKLCSAKIFLLINGGFPDALSFLVHEESRLRTSCSIQKINHDESSIYQSLPQISDEHALPHKNILCT
ncbi:hypothetical protein Tco_0360046, partial [Tanacetum coccineum]